MRALAILAAALAFGACGDDDDTKKDTADATDTSTTEVTTDATATETTTTPTDVTADETEVTTDATTPEDGDATTTADTEVVDPPQTFPEFVIELIEEGTADDADPIPFATFSTLEDDDTEGVFDGLFD